MVSLTPTPTTGLVPTASQWQGWFDQTAAAVGTVAVFSTFVEASTAATLSTTLGDVVQTMGYTLPGDGGDATYVCVAAIPVYNPGFTSVNGAHYAYQQSNPINAACFGAQSDPTLTFDNATALDALGLYLGSINPSPALTAVGISIANPAVITPNMVAAFTGAIAATGVLTVTSVTFGNGNIAAGLFLSAAGLNGQTLGVTITSQLTGTTGQAGTYQTNVTQTLSARAMTAGQWHGYQEGQPIKFGSVTASGITNGQLYWIQYGSATISTFSITADNPWAGVGFTPQYTGTTVTTTGTQSSPATMEVMGQEWVAWKLNPGVYHISSNAYRTCGAQRVRILAYGATVDNFPGLSGGGTVDYNTTNPFFPAIQVPFQTFSARTAPTADNAITLVNVADAALFHVNGWVVLMAGNNQGAGGYPPNVTLFEYLQVYSIDTVNGIVTFEQNIRYSYRSNLPYFGSAAIPYPIGGPAIAIPLSGAFDVELECYGLTVTAQYQAQIGGCKSVSIYDCLFYGNADNGFPTAMQRFIAERGEWLYGTIQLDKLIDSAAFIDCDLSTSAIQSAGSTNRISYTRCRINTVYGEVKNQSFRDCDIVVYQYGSNGGVVENAVFEGCNINLYEPSPITQLIPTTAATFSAGILSIPYAYFSSNGTTGLANAIEWAVPGAKLFVSYGDSATLAAGQPFTVLDAGMSNQVVLTGSISTGGLLTVTAITGTIAVGTTLWDTDLNNQIMAAAGLNGIMVTSFGTGVGGTGTYHLSMSPGTAITSQSMSGALNVTITTDLQDFISQLVATGTWSLASGVLTVGSFSAGSGNIIPGQSLLTGTGITAGTSITSQLTGATPGGTGTYQTSGSQTLGSRAMTSTTQGFNFIPAGTNQVTFRNSGGSPAVTDQSGAPPELPPFSYFKRAFAGSQDTYQYTNCPMLVGNLVSLTVNVVRPSTIALTLTLDWVNAFNASLQNVSFSQAINLAIAGTRVIGPTLSGAQTGDTLTAFSGWLNGAMQWSYDLTPTLAQAPFVVITGLTDQGINYQSVVAGGITALNSGKPMTLAGEVPDL